MSEKRFRLDYEEDDAIFIVEDDDIVYPIRNDTIKEFELQKLVDKLNEQQSTINRQSEQHKQILNELINENSELRMKIVSLENEIQRQKNEIKNIRKEFTKKTEELNWLKSEDYLKKIY